MKIWKKQARFIIIISTTLLIKNICFAHEITDEITHQITNALASEGFENVRAKIDDCAVIVSYENRLFRDEAEAAYSAIKIILQYIKKANTIVIIPQLRNIPIICIKYRLNIAGNYQSIISAKQITNIIEVSMETDEYWDKIKNIEPQNTTHYKADLIINPQIKVKFGAFGKPVKAQINIAPELRTTIWKGMSLAGQIVIPLINELDSLGNYVRPGLMTFSQLIRLPYNTFVTGNAGYFFENRLGVEIEIKNYAFKGRLSTGATFGYTKYSFVQNGKWYYTRDNIFTTIVSLFYREPQLDLYTGVSYGKFNEQSTGVRVDVSRQFGETEIGLFYTNTTIGSNGGFNISIPLPPSKYWQIKTIRIRPPEKFNWEYRYKYLSSNNKIYTTGNELSKLINKFNPDYIKKQLILYYINNL